MLASIHLFGHAPITIARKDRTIVNSIGAQVAAGTGLTEKQLTAMLHRIEQYRTELERRSIDVDMLLDKKPLRIKLRELDRTVRVSLTTFSGTSELAICITSANPRALLDATDLSLATVYDKGAAYVPITEHTLYTVLSTVVNNDDTIVDDALMEAFNKIVEIKKTPDKYTPYVDYVDRQLVPVNVSKSLREYLDQNRLLISNSVEYVSLLKECGVSQKSDAATEYIGSLVKNPITKKVITSPSTRFRFDPTLHELDSACDVIADLQSWPLIVVVDSRSAYQTVTKMYTALLKHLSSEEMTVFFRLDRSNSNYLEFNDFVKDNKLNNYIDDSIKVVFISKNKIPKPLVTSTWKPKSGLLVSMHEYGKVAAYLNDLPAVYYYNNSILQYKNIQGFKSIVDL